MARIVIITHTFDAYEERPYLLRSLVGHWRTDGHRVMVVEGTQDWPEADVALLHVDQSLVPQAYADACARYHTVINGRALDIRKKLVSTQQLGPGDAWPGPVIVKTDLNRGGAPEMRYLHQMRQAGRPTDAAMDMLAYSKGPYPIMRSIADVPPDIWNNPGLLVERFLPERDLRGFWMRVWVFFGRQERCTRYLGEDPLVKGDNILARESVAVPPELRAQRERLGFDFGKFDFVVHDDRAVLLDANRTPFAPQVSLNPQIDAQNAQLALGLRDWLNA